MGAGNRNTHIRWQRKRSKKLIKVLAVLVVFIAVSVVIEYFLYTKRHIVVNTDNQNASVPAVRSLSSSVFTTPYFQVKTDKNWRLISNESTDNKYVYNKANDSIIEAYMTVYVDTIPQELAATRVLPVSRAANSQTLKAGFVSEHCKDNVPDSLVTNDAIEKVRISSVSFLCDVGSSSYTVVVGTENEDSTMELRRSNGVMSSYMIYFKDLRFKPDPSEFESIMNTFQIR